MPDHLPRPRPSRALRESLFQRSGGRCQRDGCGVEIQIDAFHVAHLRAHAHEGALVEENLEAWCVRCNLTFGVQDVRDTRMKPRGWQLKALDRVIERIIATRVATVAAAPGAGKTIFAALIFEALRDADVVDRMVVLAPRRTLVQQWHDSILAARQVEIRPGYEVERKGQQGVVVTYQSLGTETVAIHRRQADLARTLYVLDEVHHVGEPNDAGDRPGWARFVTELIGDVRDTIYVRGVLNLSGTLWRSRATERISTVRYVRDDDGGIRSDVDFEVTAAELIRDGQLRPVDLFRRGATVELVKLAAGERIVSAIADLDEKGAARTAIRELPTDPAWRDTFVAAVLDRLELRHRDLGKGPAKALIVARSQEAARAFLETVNRQMRDRGLRPIAELAVSDDPNAQDTLKRFRSSKRVGVLCTVDMAGEGYDCPDISVVGFATNKLTPLYVRQVVARAQRVTAYERDVIGHPIPAAIIIPDVPDLVRVMSSILEPMRHEIKEVDEQHPVGDDAVGTGSGTLGLPTYILDGVADHVEGDARVTGDVGGDVAMSLVRRVEPEAESMGLPGSDTPRWLLSIQRALTTARDSTPFDPLSPAEAELADALAPAEAPDETPPIVEALSIEQETKALQGVLKTLGGWWATHASQDMPVSHWQNAVNEAAGIAPGGRRDATREQLRRAAAHARRLVATYCADKHLPRPRIMQADPEGGDEH